VGGGARKRERGPPWEGVRRANSGRGRGRGGGGEAAPNGRLSHMSAKCWGD
jgi:hypothetical protein